MNNISIEIEIGDKRLRSTLFQTLQVEMAATRNERGFAQIEIEEDILCIKIMAEDYVAARALTNSILRLAKTSIDVADSINIQKKSETKL
jgi:tRNA threonylcarbamoyladenosine modification (KEOPS) complex  Pcc1 subunit